MNHLILVFTGVVLVLVPSSISTVFRDEDYKRAFPNNEDQSTLKLVSVLFRHGNRTRETDELYPNDPHLNFTYFPYGHGQLTNFGKRKLYNVGVSLRNRYNTFLGEYYYPELVEAITTNYNRTKMSLELLLAGLFPPRKDDLIAEGLPWQPIPYNYLTKSEDKILLGDNCPRFQELLDKYKSSPKVQNKYEPYLENFSYLTKHTGTNFSSFHEIYDLFFCLGTEEEFGLVLPEWTKSVWPEPITSLAAEDYFIYMGLPDMKKILVGYFFEKILNDAVLKTENNVKLSRKIHLYSAHEKNVAHVLMALGIFKKHIPTYGSHIIFELHEINGTYGFKVFYDDGSGLTLMKLPRCKKEFCPLEIFQFIIGEYLPTDILCGC